ncbi:hypothetical protein BAZOLSSOX_2618 [uncultured Gammaproteobacteria bacterium]|nr:hypothetical protein BAZOLSSOX_2618 [uncultured Gammaproteobacteria bacterium]
MLYVDTSLTCSPRDNYSGPPSLGCPPFLIFRPQYPPPAPGPSPSHVFSSGVDLTWWLLHHTLNTPSSRRLSSEFSVPPAGCPGGKGACGDECSPQRLCNQEPGTQYVYQSEKRRLDKKGTPIDKEEGYMFIPEKYC